MENTRSPIVVVLGHVDHGKTTLLDSIRKTSVAAREAGGITQKIGASVVTTKDGSKITFIDTPGHAAFSGMRGRGASVADIAVLVVAADDGIKPQTREAIEHIKNTGIPFVVALTKTDLPGANVQNVLGQLEKEGIFLEKRGGDTPWIEVSAKEGKGLAELLEIISLMWEVGEVKSDPAGELEAVVIESAKEKSGCIANIVVRNGKLKVGDTIYTTKGSSRVRNLIGENGPVKEVLPGEPAQVLGFEEVPTVGSMISNKPQEVEKRAVGKANQKDGLLILVKASNAGTLEAVLGGLPEGVTLLESEIGDINESDVLSAKSGGAHGIFAFESKTSASVLKLAEAEGVRIFTFKIIYELFDKLTEILKSGAVEVLGKAEIKAEFPFDGRRVAGCRMLNGKLSKSGVIVLARGEKEMGRVKILSLKKQKQEVNEVSQGEEFGALFTPHLDFTIGVVILALSK